MCLRSSFRISLYGLVLVVLGVTALMAQDDAPEAPLGDFARNLRKRPQPSQEVIDNDNLPQVMDDVGKLRMSRTSFQYSIDPAGKTFRISTPDATCSLSFTPNAKALLSNPYAQLDLPPDELQKLAGPAGLDGDSIEISLFNGTDWHLSEIAVALTVKRRQVQDPVHPATKPSPSAAADPESGGQQRLEKPSDTTVLYKIRAAGAPFSTTIFRAQLGMEIGPDEEWHWAIVQARGYPPPRSLNASSPAFMPSVIPAPEAPAPASPPQFPSPVPPGQESH